MRHQLPVSSPLPPSALAIAAAGILRPAADDRARLLSLLLRENDAAGGVLTGSGTQALQLAIFIARDGDGDAAAPVALPAFTCYDVAAAAVGAGAPIALYDVDPVTLAPELDSLERVLAAGARVAVVAWAYGHPPPWDEVLAMADRHGATVIEDAAQGHGAVWRGRRAGSFGALSVLSFGRGKGWTGGHGGALLVRDPHLPLPDLPSRGLKAEMENVATTAAQWALGRPSLYSLPASIPGLALGETVYRDPTPPRSILRSAATILLRTRAEADREAMARRRNARRLVEVLAESPGPIPVAPVEGAEPGYLRLPLLVGGGMARLGDAARRLGIAPAYPSTLAALPAVRARLAGPERRFPGADALAAALVTLPTHSHITARDMRDLAALFRRPPPLPAPTDRRPAPLSAR